MGTELDIAKRITEKYDVRLPQKELELFASIIDCWKLAKNEIFLRQGQIAKNFIYVESGMIRQFYYKRGHDITEHFTCDGNTLAFCIASLFKKEPTNLMMEALEPSVVHTIPCEKLKELSTQHSEIAKLLFRILELGLIISQQKADSWRFETARERYERFSKEYPQAAKRASVNHIASYLLMTPESLSRVRAGTL
ncbi:MAG: Crp/Fnr family transcriptional regulator [Bacteroidales bacterium]|nr:Crp/Fnr family transcriptional regulator [Bacteroidales bacterium]